MATKVFTDIQSFYNFANVLSDETKRVDSDGNAVSLTGNLDPSGKTNLAVELAKIYTWYTNFSWAVFTAPTVAVTGSGNAITSASYGTGTNANKLTLTKGTTFLTQHPTIPVETDTTSTASPDHGGTFTSVDSVTRDSNGHVLKINTKTVTLPAQYTHPTYTARTGKPTENQTPAFGATFTISQIKSDGTGHVTAATDRTVKIPDTTMGAATADTAGTIGLVPAPAAGKQSSFLRGDGTWVVPTNTDTKVTITNLAQSTAAANYKPTFVDSAGTKGVNIIGSYQIGHLPGTTTDVGNTRLILGNATAEGTADNEEGLLRLYTSGTGYITLKGVKNNSNTTHTFPTVGGTIWNSGNAVSTSIGSASTGTALKASKVTLGTALKASKVTLGTALSASKVTVNSTDLVASKVTLGTALSASKVTLGTALSASKVTLGTALSASKITAWSAGTQASLTTTTHTIPNVTSATDVTIKNITGVTAVSIPNVTGNSNVSIPNVTGNTEVTIPNVTDVTDVTIPNVTAATDVSVYSVKTINTVVTTAKISKGVLTFSTGASVVRESKTASKVTLGDNLTASKVTLGTALKASKVTLGTALSASKVTLGTALSASKVTVGSTDLTASKVTLGDAFSVKAVNVFTKNTVPSLSYDDVSIPNVTGNTSVSIPNVTGNTSVSIPNVTGVTDVTIKNITGVTDVSIPNVTGNTEVTIPNVTGNTEVTIPNISVTSKNVLSTDIS